MAQNVTVAGASYSDVPSVELPKTGGGTAQFDDTTDANATAADIALSKTAYVNGVKLVGTNQGGGGVDAGQIYQDGAGYIVLDDDSGGKYDPSDSTATAADILYPKTAYISGGKVTGSIVTKSSSDLTASGDTVTAPAGYYATAASKSVASGSASTPATTITANPSISVDSDGLVTATVSGSKSIAPTVSAGYVSSGTAGTVSVSGSNTSQLSTQSATTITPSTTAQTAVAAGKYTTGAVTVAAMPTGTAGTPTANKSVSGNTATITPSVTNTTGYITGGTKTGTAVTVSASELVSGTKSITANGTGIDVTEFAAVDVAVPSVSPTLITKSITANGTYNASSDNADGYSSVTVNVSGGGGLVYEAGTFTPAEDITRPVISFSNVHTNKPSLVLISDVEETLATANTAEYFAILNWFDCFGVAQQASGTIMNYARIQFGYKTSAGLTQGGYVINDYNGSSATTALGYYLSNSSFTPYAGSDSRYFSSGRTYKWIAVWAPTS